MTYSKHSLAKRYFFSKTSQNAEDYTDFFIRYKPERLEQLRLSRTRRALQKILFMALLIWLPLTLLYLHDMTTSLICFVGIAALLYVIMFNTWRVAHLLAPTHIQLNEKGLRFHWLHLFHRAKTPLITWDRISHVTDRKSVV